MGWFKSIRKKLLASTPTYDGVGGGRRAVSWSVGNPGAVGGAPTSKVILDATSNAIFPDISELDRSGGRVNLRKVHVSVQTPDTDTYLGCNVIVAVLANVPNAGVGVFDAMVMVLAPN